MYLVLQILWAIGCFAWNAYGLYLLSQGQKAIGPTASFVGAGLCLIFALLLWWFHVKQRKWPYIVLSAIVVGMAALTIYGSFTKDLSLWPSEGWRWTGIILNGVGFFSSLIGIINALKRRNMDTIA